MCKRKYVVVLFIVSLLGGGVVSLIQVENFRVWVQDVTLIHVGRK